MHTPHETIADSRSERPLAPTTLPLSGIAVLPPFDCRLSPYLGRRHGFVPVPGEGKVTERTWAAWGPGD